MSRKCPNCKHVKDNSAFIDNKKICEDCLENIRTRRAANPQKMKEIQHRNYMNHQEERKAKQRTYRSENLDAVRAYDRKRYPQRRDRSLAYLRVYRVINKEILAIKKFIYNETCREYNRKKGKEYRINNGEKFRASGRATHAKNRAKYNAKSRIYYGKNRVILLQKQRAYHKNNPDVKRKHNALRRARKNGAPRIESIKHIDVAERDKWTCHICHKRVTRKAWSIDHLIPLVDGGSHTMDNVALAHRNCNARRGARRTIPVQLRLLG